MDESHRKSAERVRSEIERGLRPPSFRDALMAVPAAERDAWVDRVLGLGELPSDGRDLPSGCVPYLPCSVDALLRTVDHAPVRASDVFVDVGSGVGRAAALVHLLTGAPAVGLEIQRDLVVAARELAARLVLSRVSFVEGDALVLAERLGLGSVFFLYCPFGGERVTKLLSALEPIARTKAITICCIDLPLPPCSWLVLEPSVGPDLAIHRSTLHLSDRGLPA
jgi:SAM-dependent methyltransferase